MKEKITNVLDITFWKFVLVGIVNTLVKQLGMFVINITICYLLAYGMAKPVVSWILHNQSKSVQENLSMLVGMGAFVVFNYVGQRLVVFKK